MQFPPDGGFVFLMQNANCSTKISLAHAYSLIAVHRAHAGQQGPFRVDLPQRLAAIILRNALHVLQLIDVALCAHRALLLAGYHINSHFLVVEVGFLVIHL